MGGGSGGGGKSGRSGGGDGGGGGGETLDERIARSYRELGMTPPSEMTKAERDASNSRNLEFSRQSDIMEGGRSFENPSIYKSNAPPKYKKQIQKAKEAESRAKSTWEFPKNPKIGDTVTNQHGTKLKWRGNYWDNLRYGES